MTKPKIDPAFLAALKDLWAAARAYRRARRDRHSGWAPEVEARGWLDEALDRLEPFRQEVEAPLREGN